MIFSTIQIIPFQSSTIEKVSAGSTWVQETESDFEAGMLVGTEINKDGDLILAKDIFYQEDNFNSEFKISEKDSVFVDTLAGEARLMKLNKIFVGNEWDGGYGVQQTSDGGFIIIGRTKSFGGGDEDIWLIKTDAEGNEIWNNVFGGNAYDFGASVLETDDGGYILCGSTSSYGAGWHDVWLIKTNANGEEQWSQTYGGDQFDFGHSIQHTADGGYIIAGETQSFGTGSTSFPPNSNVWFIKTDSSGIEEWSKTWGGDDYDTANCVKQTSDGGFIIVGVTQSIQPNANMWLIKTDSSGNEHWNKSFGGTTNGNANSVVEASDGGFVAVGALDNYITMSTDLWLVKTDSNGNKQWSRTHGGDGSEEGLAIIATDDGGFLITGLTWSYGNGETDLWLLKTNGLGFEQWNKTIGWSYSDWGTDIKETSDNGYILTGCTDYDDSAKGDVWLVRTDNSGNHNPVGTLNSINLLSGQSPSGLDSFTYTATIPQGTNIRVQFSEDYYNWYNSNNISNEWDLLIDGTHNIDLTSLNWQTSNFYYRLNFTSNNINIPSISNVNISFTNYFLNGAFESKPFDSGGSSNWKNIYWTSDEPHGTFIKLQVRSGYTKDEMLAKPYVGLNGEESNFYTNKNDPIWKGHYGKRWLQVKAYLERYSYASTPILKEFGIIYNCIPEAPMLLAPANNTLFNSSQPTFHWEFNDLDSELPAGFQWQAAKNSDFISIDYDSGDISSNRTNYTIKPSISDGIWYWRVRTCDVDGDWGVFCNYSTIMIDTTINRPIGLTTTPNNWTSINSFSITWSNPEDLSGIIGGYYKLDSLPESNTDGIYTPGYNLTSISGLSVPDSGEHTIFIWLVDKAGNIDFNKYISAKLYYDALAPKPPINPMSTPDYWSSNTSFTLDWTDPFDHSGLRYGAYYYIGNSPPTSNTDGTWVSSKPLQLSIDNEGERNVYLWLEDNLSNKNYLNYSIVPVKLDISPPKITHSSVTKAKKGENIEITATITDEHSGIDVVLLYFKNNKDSTYTIIIMRQAGKNYVANITSNQIKDEKIGYYLIAQDKSMPKNVVYFGISGETTNEPNSITDIDIKITEEGGGFFGALSSDSNSLWLLVGVIIIIVILIIILFIYFKKKKKPESIQEDQETTSTPESTPESIPEDSMIIPRDPDRVSMPLTTEETVEPPPQQPMPEQMQIQAQPLPSQSPEQTQKVSYTPQQPPPQAQAQPQAQPQDVAVPPATPTAQPIRPETSDEKPIQGTPTDQEFPEAPTEPPAEPPTQQPAEKPSSDLAENRIQCPTCENQMQTGITTCPFCGTELKK